MKTLTKDDVRTWCQQKSIKVTNDNWLYFHEQDRRCFTIELPEKPGRLVYLANALLLPFAFDESVPFQGALVWIREWGIWDEHVERVGYRVMEVTRRVHGDSRRLEEAPGNLFNEEDLFDLQVCFVQPLLIGWDAFLVPESGDYIVAVSHDEYISVIGRTQQIHERLFSVLQPWSPRENSEGYFRGTRDFGRT